ncbi:MAG: trimethylamine methyltransferase family protein [Candidatus Bathyarchaeia archaeon]|nr:trimethylamine methyltransferase family protein [Candidatus Bathyarchaeota archaeon]
MKLFEPLTKDEIQRIHAESLDILENVGFKVQHEDTLKLLKSAGAVVDCKEKNVRIHESLVLELLRKAPSSFVLAARDPRNDFKVPGGRSYFCSSPAPYIVEGKTARLSTKSDAADWVRLGDYLKNIHLCIRTHVMDKPAEVRDLHGFEVSLNNTTKHVVGIPHSSGAAKYFNKMAAAVLGNEEILRKRALFSTGACINSPLEWPSNALDVFMSTSEYNIPAHINSEPIMGVSSPVTIAGTLVINNAEILSGIVINQLYKERRPCIYAVYTHAMNFKTAEVTSSGSNEALVAAAAAQLARFYNIPSSAWMCTNSKTVDAQSGFESMLTCAFMTLSGIDIIWGAGQLESQKSVSFEKLLIDNDLIEMMLRSLEDIEVSEDTLAADVIRKVGPKGKFLQEQHTMKYYLKEHPSTLITDYHNRRKWEKLGSRDIAEAARSKVEEILRTHQPTPLPRDCQDHLKRILSEYEKETLTSC